MQKERQKQGSDYDKDDVNAVVLNDLSFGRIVIGLTHEKNVPCTDTQAGRVIVSGLSKEEDVTLKFELPHELRSFGHALEIDFGASSAAWSTSNDPRNATLFNPNSYFEIPSSALGSGQLYLWIGGTIILNQQQASGSYDGRILMQVQINHGSY